MNQTELCFFEAHPGALPLYETFAERFFAELGPVTVRISKTQITFSNRYGFAFASASKRPRKAK